MRGNGQTMKQTTGTQPDTGYSLLELLIAMVILIPIMGAAIGFFSVGAEEHASEQSSIDVNQEARSALEIMTTEISQAGSHGDRDTTMTSAVGASSTPQNATLASAEGIMTGDWLDVDSGSNWESVEVTAVSENGITGVFRTSHAAGTPVRLFALPYRDGVAAPTAIAANSSATATRISFFGDINGDSTLQYVEYIYDSANNQITRSITPLTQSTKNPAFPLVRNIAPNTVQFRLNTDDQGVVTAADVAMTVRNTWGAGPNKQQDTRLSTRIAVPCAMAASRLLFELRRFGGVDKLPPVPPKVTTWVSQ